MFDVGASELLLIVVVAIVVIGPKELPAALRLMGRWTAKARAMAREFQGHVDDMVREAELDEVRKQVEKTGSDITRDIEKTVDPQGEVTKALSAPDSRARFSASGAVLPLGTPEAFGAHIAAETKKFGDVIKRANIKIN